MSKKKPFEEATDELLRINSKELSLRVVRETYSPFLSSGSEYLVRHDLIYSWTEEGREKTAVYHIEHRNFSERNFTPDGLARLLHEDLLKISEQGKKLRKRGIHLRTKLNGLLLGYLGHGQYLELEDLDVLTMADLIGDLERKHKIRKKD